MIEKITKAELYKVLTVKKAIAVFGYPVNNTFKRIIKSLENSNSNSNIHVFIVLLDDHDTIIEEFKLTMQPTIIAYDHGREKGRIDDYDAIEIILDMYENKEGD